MTDEIVVDPRVEKIIWRGLGTRSVRQMAEDTGLSPEQIFAIKRDLLSAVDVLSVSERKAKLLVMLEEMAHEALDRASNSSDEFSAGHFNAARGAMKDALTELNRQNKGEQEAITALNNLRINELVRLIELSVSKTFAVLSDRHGLSEDEMFEVFHSYLKPAAEEIEA